ncbi:hypothetical protein HAX54_023807 [Datura stramonium]|uniref:HTH myb-type domain-containing protein n=1 Tax=Datura stramonium TaxID=4076 RepID=A0ABS8UYQ8_DATST|nr:hypothetical protein [Datura stramonium]
MMEFSMMKKRSSQKIGVRQYKKSSVPRLRWTPQLHELFIQAVQHLGGGHKATPKRIQQMMAVKGLKISHVKSHLQMYRNLKERSNLNIVRSLNNFHEERPQFSWSSPQHLCETLEHRSSKSSKQIEPGSDQSHYKARVDAYSDQIAENNIYYYDYQEAQGSLSSGMTKEEEEEEGGGGPTSEICHEFPQADGECEREINFWPLNDFHKNSQSHSSIKFLDQQVYWIGDNDLYQINLYLQIRHHQNCLNYGYFAPVLLKFLLPDKLNIHGSYHPIIAPQTESSFSLAHYEKQTSPGTP